MKITGPEIGLILKVQALWSFKRTGTCRATRHHITDLHLQLFVMWSCSFMEFFDSHLHTKLFGRCGTFLDIYTVKN